MTLKTCKAQLEKWKRLNDAKGIAFWEARILKKGGKLEEPKEEVKPDGKKSKRRR